MYIIIIVIIIVAGIIILTLVFGEMSTFSIETDILQHVSNKKINEVLLM